MNANQTHVPINRAFTKQMVGMAIDRIQTKRVNQADP